MSRILLVTHEGIASALLRTAAVILGQAADAVSVEVGDREDADRAQQRIERAVRSSCGERSPLILTDLPGATPHNLALAAARHCCRDARVLSGLNLPMLLRALSDPNRADDAPADLAAQAGQRARDAIFVGEPDGS